LDPDPDAPGDAGLRVRGTFRLPTEDGRVVATVEEWFTGYVLQLAGAGHRVAVEPTDAPEPIDEPIDEPVVALVPQPRAPVAPRWRRRPAREDGAAGGRRPVHLVRTPDPGTTSEIPDRRGARQW
ncbi:MAG TPA: hypothetical protein VEZ42_07280, partial [Pseudonocardia sp.]|nr:hypothetical protein [Pseudonocardia sp.]